MGKQKEDKWFTDIVDDLRRTGCGPDCEGPTPANNESDALSGKRTHQGKK